MVAVVVIDLLFLDLLEPYDCVIADSGFKIKYDLLMRQCTLEYHHVEQ